MHLPCVVRLHRIPPPPRILYPIRRSQDVPRERDLQRSSGSDDDDLPDLGVEAALRRVAVANAAEPLAAGRRGSVGLAVKLIASGIRVGVDLLSASA